jgi:2-dehydropantoate 2-reductase
MEVVHVIGAGGIGCAVGYTLVAAGIQVVFVETNNAKVVAGMRDGVRMDDRERRNAVFVGFAEWLPEPGVPVLLCTKCYDNAAVLGKLTDTSAMIPIQNGFDPQLNSKGHMVEGIASFVSECARDRPWSRITRPGDLHIGPRISGVALPAALLGALKRGAAITGLFRVVSVPDILPIKYTKLMYNAAISPLAAAAGIDNGKLLSLQPARKLFFGLLQENYRILRGAGLTLGKVGPFHPSTVSWILRQPGLARLLSRFFEPSLRGTYCSMAGEIANGRTELENYTGHLLQLAEAAHVPCPLNRAVHALVSRMTLERATPEPAVLMQLVGVVTS